ncbi:MAG: zinc-dependent alcohol dehydrogenase family protein [bacterium]
MKAAVLETIRKIIVKDIPVPKPKDNEVLIKVKVCGICGTDMKLYDGQYTAKMPVVLGHEYSGEIVEAGKEVRNFKVGDRVVSDPNESCGACYWCRNSQPCFCNNLAAYGVLRDGGFAEYATAGEKGVYKIPDDLDFESAAFTEPLSCVVHGVDRIDYRPGDDVVIIGGGPMGQIHLQFALHSGAGKVILIEPEDSRIQMAKRFGAKHVINPETEDVKKTVLDLTEGLGADVVVEVVGHTSTIEQALDLAKRGGRILIFGFAPEGEKASFVPFDILSKELTIMGSWVNPYTYSRALDILASGKIDVKPLISARIKLDNIMDGFNMMIEKPEGFMKALVEI